MVTVNNNDVMRHFLYGGNVTNRTGSFSAEHFRTEFPRVGAPCVGYLPHRLVGILNQRFRDGAIDAVVSSYSTPIAWRDSGVWIVPDVRYSITTSSKHQAHLYRLHGRHILLPYDASEEEIDRVLDGLMVYTTDARGNINGTRAAA